MSDYEPLYNMECEVVRDEVFDYEPQPGLLIEGHNIKRVHIDQHRIKKNAKVPPEERLPPISVKTSKENHKCWEVVVLGDCNIKYSPDKPLSCGAKVWIETTSEVWCDKRGAISDSTNSPKQVD